MLTLSEARKNIGAEVIYHNRGRDSDDNGVITSVNNQYVFVKFGNAQRGAACNTWDITLKSKWLEGRRWRSVVRGE